MKNSNLQEMLSFLKLLVNIDTSNPPGDNYDRVIDILETKCIDLGLKTRRVVPPKHLWSSSIGSERINLLAEWDSGSKEWLHLNAHYDVVPPTKNWKTDPFKLVIKGDKAYGRGAYDVKCQFVVYLFAIKELQEEGFKPKVNLQLSFVPDEETGGKAGFSYIVDKEFVKADYAIGEGPSNTFFQNSGKGTLHLRVNIRGKSAHAAYDNVLPSVNAFEKAIALLVELNSLKSEIVKRISSYTVQSENEKKASMVLGGEVNGCGKVNTIPDFFSFTIDRRFLPEENMIEVKKEILDVFERAKRKDSELKIDFEVLDFFDAIRKHKNSLEDNFLQAIKKVYKKEGKGVMLSGGTDMRLLSYKGIPCIGYSPHGENMHADNEYVSIKSMEKTKEVVKKLIKNW